MIFFIILQDTKGPNWLRKITKVIINKSVFFITVSMCSEGSVVADVDNFFSLLSTTNEQSVKKKIEDAASEAGGDFLDTKIAGRSLCVYHHNNTSICHISSFFEREW